MARQPHQLENTKTQQRRAFKVRRCWLGGVCSDRDRINTITT